MAAEQSLAPTSAACACCLMMKTSISSTVISAAFVGETVARYLYTESLAISINLIDAAAMCNFTRCKCISQVAWSVKQ